MLHSLHENCAAHGPDAMGRRGSVIIIIQRRYLTSVRPLEGCGIGQSHAEPVEETHLHGKRQRNKGLRSPVLSAPCKFRLLAGTGTFLDCWRTDSTQSHSRQYGRSEEHRF